MSSHPYSDRADAARKLDEINAAVDALADSIRHQIAAFCGQYDADADTAAGYIDDLISDLRFDATGPATRRMLAAEHVIALRESDDMRRNSPVTV